MSTDNTPLSTRTRGLHKGTEGHKPDCGCPPCKSKRFDALQAALTHKTELAESLTAQLEQVQAEATAEVASAERAARVLKLENQNLTFGLRATLFLLVAGTLMGAIYSWGGAPKQLPTGGETAQTLQGGSR